MDEGGKAALQITQPEPRSAYCMLNSWPIGFASPRGLLLFGGDTGLAGQRMNDVWFMDTNAAATGTAVWERLETAGPPPEPRSNCAAAVAGGELVVFGGWNAAGTTALDSAGVLNLSTLRWAPAGTLQGESPCARGQPGMMATTGEHSVIIFGGWDGKQRFNDMHSLDVTTWHWTPFLPASDVVPPARADHAVAKWRYCDDGCWKDLMVCFGGSTDAGVQNDVWLFDFRDRLWSQAFCAGGNPQARSSHAAAVIGDSLVVSGGQCRGQVLCDCWILQLDTLTWHQVEVPGMGPMCRHALAYCNGQLWGFGGFDGQDTLGGTFCLALGGLVQPGVPSNQSGSRGQSSVEEPGAAPAERLDSAKHRSGTKSVGDPGLLGSPVQLALSGFRGQKPAEEWPQQLPENNSSAIQRSEQQLATATVPGDSDLQGPQEQPGRHDSGSDAPPPSKLPGTGCNLRRLRMNFVKPGPSSENPVQPTTAVGQQALSTAPPQVEPASSGPVASAEQLWGMKPAPFTIEQLPLCDRGLKGWRLVQRMHEGAVAAERDTYVDPASGYTVFTSRYLKMRPCCGNKCRHCPHAYVNVGKKRETDQLL